jgi:hypothetical protein
MTRTEYSVLKEEIEDNECGWSYSVASIISLVLVQIVLHGWSSD